MALLTADDCARVYGLVSADGFRIPYDTDLVLLLELQHGPLQDHSQNAVKQR